MTNLSEKIVLNWSGGKDCAMSLYKLRQNGSSYDVSVLLTVLTKDYDRISMHGVQRILLEKQAQALSLHLDKIYITKDDTADDYEKAIKEKLTDYKNQGISTVAFGDIFLDDLRKHREEKLAQISMKALFPIWKMDTTELANEFIDAGFETIITCVDSKYLDKNFVGRLFSKQFLSELPEGVDPCGENGEFHSFTYDGPIFDQPVPFKKGQIVLRENRFYYCDLLPVSGAKNN